MADKLYYNVSTSVLHVWIWRLKWMEKHGLCGGYVAAAGTSELLISVIGSGEWLMTLCIVIWSIDKFIDKIQYIGYLFPKSNLIQLLLLYTSSFFGVLLCLGYLKKQERKQ